MKWSGLIEGNLYLHTAVRVLRLMKGRHKLKALAVLMLSFIHSVIEVVGLAFVIPVIYLINDPEPIQNNRILHSLYETFHCTSNNQFILLMMIALLLIFLFKNISAVIIQNSQNKYSYSISYDLLASQFEQFFDISFEDYLKKNPSYFVREIAIVPNDFSIHIFIPLIAITNELLVMTIIVIGLLLFNVKILLLLAVTILPVMVLTMGLTKRRAFHIGIEKNRTEPEKYKRIYDNVNSFLDIKIYEMERPFIEKAVKPFRQLYDLYIKTLLYQSLPQRIMEVVVILTIALAFYLIVFVLDQTSGKLVLTLALFATASYRVMPSADRIMKMLIDIRTSEYVFDILKAIDDEPYERRNQKPVEDFNTAIALSGVSYSYRGHKPAISDIDLTILKGEIIGLIGESGCGKTTLARILTGLIRNFTGDFVVDGNPVDRSEYNWINLASLVQQDFSILNLSLAENIAYGQSRDEMNVERIEDVAEKVGLNQITGRSGDGIWMEIKDDGKNLSGGQKQRIAIARALYRGKKLLVLDESTNALDEAAEKEIMQLIYRLSREQKLTTVIISHQLSNLIQCDKTYKLKEGRLLATDIPE